MKKISIPLTAAIMVVLVLSSFSFSDRGIQIQEKRFALVIGNGSYKSSPLKNPVNDARDIARILKKLGFEVIHKENSGLRAMEKSIRQFGKKLRNGGVGLFYFAGHGMQVKGRNYLIPVDAEIETESDAKFEAVDAGRILGKMEDAGNDLNIVILDACRNNPFARSFRSSQKGLAQMDAPSGSMISYATAPGRVAADGTDRNGIFTKHLLLQLRTSDNIELAQLMKGVGKGVQNETGKKQVPWVSSSITGDFYFKGKGVAQSIQPSTLPDTYRPISINEEEEFWLAIKNSDSAKDFEKYLNNYPDGRFVDIAKIKIRHLSEEKVTLNESINYAKTARVAASSYYSAMFGETFPPNKVIDGNIDENCRCAGPCISYWLLPDHRNGYIQLHLARETLIHKIQFLNTYNRRCKDRATLGYHVDVITSDNTTITVKRGQLQFTTNPQWHEISFEPTKVKSVIFYVDSYYNNGGGLNEIEIY